LFGINEASALVFGPMGTTLCVWKHGVRDLVGDPVDWSERLEHNQPSSDQDSKNETSICSSH
jgi:hypothetical protein